MGERELLWKRRASGREGVDHRTAQAADRLGLRLDLGLGELVAEDAVVLEEVDLRLGGLQVLWRQPAQLQLLQHHVLTGSFVGAKKDRSK